MEESKKAAYARQLLTAINLQKGQLLYLSASVDSADFVHILVREAFAMGAYDVDVDYSDAVMEKLKINHADEASLTEEPEWKRLHMQHVLDNGACILSVSSPNHKAFEGVDMERLKLTMKSPSKTRLMLSSAIDSGKYRWLGAAIPNPVWAKEIFPELDENEAVERLWEEIIRTSYADADDPAAAWKEHVDSIMAQRNKLDALKLAKLHFTASNGTDVEVGLCDNSVFDGGCEVDTNGLRYTPNVPTEEVFTSPHRLKINGVVKSTKPLMRSGVMINDFTLRFENGKVTEVHAAQGEEILKQILETDEGSSYIGEVAFVPKSSPINKAGHLFYSTAFDENATCHMALGRGFVTAIDTKETDKEKLTEMGLNYSKIHVDFMFGTDDIMCVGTSKDGREIVIMKDGEFVI